MTSMGRILFPHWMLKPDTAEGAKNRNQLMPKLDGFQMWRFLYRNTYFEVIEMIETNANGQSKIERIRILTLIPLMYALERFFHFP
jgi:hypothetical protein